MPSLAPRNSGGEGKKYRISRPITKKAPDKKSRNVPAFVSRMIPFVRGHIPQILLIVLILVCAGFVLSAIRTPVTMEFSIDGRVIGAVESNLAVDGAVRELEENVSEVLGNSFQFPHEIKYSFTRRSSAKTLSKEEISEVLYTYLPDTISTGAGLFVDDVLVAAGASEDEVQSELKALVIRHMGLADNVGILNSIRVETRAFPAESILERDALRSLLEEMTVAPEERDTAVPRTDPLQPAEEQSEDPDVSQSPLLCDMSIPTITPSRKNAYEIKGIDGVQLVFYTSETLRYEENIPYSIEYDESRNLYTSMADVTRPGVPGKNDVTARVYYVDGREARREVLSETVEIEPVSEIVTLGTRVLPEDLGIKGVKGRFIMPRIDTVTSPFGEREMGFHQGWDVNGDEGDNIYAAASGTVVTAIGQDGGFTYSDGSTYTGYGYCVIIEHEEGYTTLYAHCSRINVVLGQEVKQGDKIAEVGETGDAYGAHVHFEIRKGGVRLDPGDGYMYTGKTTVYDIGVPIFEGIKETGKQKEERQFLLEK